MQKKSGIQCVPHLCGVILLLLVFQPATLWANQATDSDQVNWQWWGGIGAEWFQWDEFLNGERELREEGPRVSLATGIKTRQHNESGPVISLSGRFTFGQVDYDGSVQWQATENADSNSSDNDGNGKIDLVSPATTTTDYRAFHFIGEGGYRFQLTQRHTLEALGGLELDSWSRSLQSTSDIDIAETEYRDSDGNISEIQDYEDDFPEKAGGYTETYFLLAARASLGMGHNLWRDWLLDWRLGARYPFLIDEYDSGTGANLEPKGRVSNFAEARLSNRGSPWSLLLYFEEYNFDESDWEPAGFADNVLVKQPRSESYRAGLAIKYQIK
ncbi:hypothetical protein [Halorhodospira halochloris]|uniref:hypothetical protein n=1 Tax=Halorhodospira halochloris TaxID=1052 RepID=UPI001EE92B62|nr:hypothetical protein [Halorhodospira halochloris]MCG5547592.1 hypothetical protein [Halorhodospira halochloris]